MDTKLKTPTQLLQEDNEYSQAILFASNYKDANTDMDNYVTTSMLADFLIKFKKEHIDKYWYNAGLMSQRILQNDEIEILKGNLKKEELRHRDTRNAWDETAKERDELKNKVDALCDRIKIMNNILHPNE